MKSALVVLLLILAPTAHATCDDTLKVQSREILLSYADPAPRSRVDYSVEDEHEHFRRMAYALAVGQRALERISKYSDEFGAPMRAPMVLDRQGRVVAFDHSNPYAIELERICQGAVGESTCVLWTSEIGRFKSKASADSWLGRHGNVCDFDLMGNVELHETSPEALVIFGTCKCIWEPGTFIVRLPAASRWSARRGLFLSRWDAESYARLWTSEIGRKVGVVRQRVDGALLEQALREPVSEDL